MHPPAQRVVPEDGWARREVACDAAGLKTLNALRNWSGKKGAMGRPHATHSPADSTTRSLCFQATVPISPSPPLEPSWATLPSSLPSRRRLPRNSRAREGESGSRHPVNPNPSHAPTGNRCPLLPATPPTPDQAHHSKEVTLAGLRRAPGGAAPRLPWHSICEEIGAVKREKVLDWLRGSDGSSPGTHRRFHAGPPTGS